MAIDLRRFTPARVGLDRTGNSLTTPELLRFQLDHARARDAVFEELDPRALPLEHLLVRSSARDREEFLRRPDLGRRLAEESRGLLRRGVEVRLANVQAQVWLALELAGLGKLFEPIDLQDPTRPAASAGA